MRRRIVHNCTFNSLGYGVEENRIEVKERERKNEKMIKERENCIKKMKK